MSLPFESNVSSKYGAPMGRHSDPFPHFGSSKLHLRKVAMFDSCYDKGGAYWGAGVQLWCVWDDENTAYLRAATREGAKAEIIRLKGSPAEFFR